MSETRLPVNWTTVRVKDIAKILYGKALLANSRAESGKFPVYGSGGTSSNHDTFLHKGPSIIIGRKGNVGAIYLVDKPFWCIDTAFYLDSISEAVDIAFLMHALQVANLAQYTKSVAIPGISRDDIENVVIPLPPLPEQRRIADILREADEFRQLRQEANEKTQKIAEALFYDMFGDPIRNEKKWKVTKIKKICKLVRGSSPRPQGDPRYFGGPVPRLMVADITRDGLYVTPKIDSLTEEGAKLSRPMKAGSVVMAVSGAPGLPAILNVDACIHDGFVGFRDLSSKINNDFLLYLLRAIREKNNAQAVGATFKNLKTDQIKDWFVPLPPIQLQNQYSKLLSHLKEGDKKIAEASTRFDELSQSLLSQAFTGELTASWREQHVQELAQAARERDILLKGKATVAIEIKATAALALPEEETDREDLLAQLSSFQRALYGIFVKNKDSYFTANQIYEDDGEELHASLDQVRRELLTLAGIGLIREVLLRIMEQPEQVYYLPVYRYPQPEDDTRSEDLELLGSRSI